MYIGRRPYTRARGSQRKQPTPIAAMTAVELYEASVTSMSNAFAMTVKAGLYRRGSCQIGPDRSPQGDRGPLHTLLLQYSRWN